MSLNLRLSAADDGDNRWELRREQLVAVIRAFGPDVLGTQECLAEQAGYLRQALPECGFVGVGREDGRLAGEMCAIFYRADRFRKLAEGHFWLSEKPDSAGSVGWDAALTRMVSWVELAQADDPKQVFWFFNTHFDHMGALARLRSAGLLRDAIIRKTGFARTIVTGDFNAPADSSEDGPYRALTEEMLDAYRALHAPSADEGTYHGFTGRAESGRVDWILVTPDLVPVESQIVRSNVAGRYPSDHFPVTAVVELPAP